MKFSRLIKIKEYVSAAGLFEGIKALNYLLRRSFLGLPRIELLEVFNLEDNEFKITIPNYWNGSKRNVSLRINEKIVIAIICNLLTPKMVIEIGTFRGETTDLMAHNLVDADI
jgi:hypothetical protein